MSISDGTYTVGGTGGAEYASVTAALADINQSSTSQLVKLEIISDTTEGTWALNQWSLPNVKNVEIYNQVPHNGNPLVGPKLVGATVDIGSTLRIIKIHDVYFKNSAISIVGSADPTHLNFFNGINRIYNLLIEGGSLTMIQSDYYVGYSASILYDYPTIVNAKIWGMAIYVELISFNNSGSFIMGPQNPYGRVVLENVTIMRTNPSDIGLRFRTPFSLWAGPTLGYTTACWYNVTNLALVNCSYTSITGPDGTTDTPNFGTLSFISNGLIASTEFVSLDPADGADFLKPKLSISTSGAAPLVSWNTSDIANNPRPWSA